MAVARTPHPDELALAPARKFPRGDRGRPVVGAASHDLTANTSAEPSYSRRAAAVRRTITEMGLDALIVTHPPNLRYLTGFGGSMGVLLLARRGRR